MEYIDYFKMKLSFSNEKKLIYLNKNTNKIKINKYLFWIFFYK